MAEILKGAPVAAALTEKLIAQVENLKSKNIFPTLAIIRVGENPGDISYETGAVKRCEKIGIDVKKFILPEISCGKVLDVIEEINSDKKIHGCLMLRPLPDKKTESAACEILSPEKDIDCMTEKSLARVFIGGREEFFTPCTAQACMEILDFYGIKLEGKNIAVVGRSLVIGKPVSMLLQNRNATVTMCHSRTKNLEDICKNSEIIVAAIGKANFIDKNFLSPGQVVIDVGINLGSDGKLCGDVNFSDAEKIVKAVTPVPGGVGAVTTAVMAKNVIKASRVRN